MKCEYCVKEAKASGEFKLVREVKNERGQITDQTYQCQTCPRTLTRQAMPGKSL